LLVPLVTRVAPANYGKGGFSQAISISWKKLKISLAFFKKCIHKQN